jgi:transposase
MLRVDHQRWSQTATDLRHLALCASHARSRERFLALHDIAQGACATVVAERTGRHPQTVMGWLHSYNEHGPEALLYRRTGGRPPFAQRSRQPWVKRSASPSNRPPIHL